MKNAKIKKRLIAALAVVIMLATSVPIISAQTTSAEETNTPASITLNVGATSEEQLVSENSLVGDAGLYTTSDGKVAYEICHYEIGDEGYVPKAKGALKTGDKVIISDGANYAVCQNGVIAATTNPTKATVWTVESESEGIYCFHSESDSFYLSHNGNTLGALTEKSDANWSFSSENGIYYQAQNENSETETYYLNYDAGWNVSATTTARSSAYSMTYTTVKFTGLDIATGESIQVGVPTGDYKTFSVDVVANDTVTVSVNLDTIDDNTGASKTLDAVKDLGLKDVKLPEGISLPEYTVTYALQDSNTDVISLDDNKVTGKKAGTAVVTATVTSAAGNVVGTVSYNCAVSGIEISDTKNIYVPVGKTSTVEGLTGELNTEMLDESKATASLSNGTLTVTGVAVGDTAVVVGTVRFNVYTVNANTSKTVSKYLYVYIREMDHTTVYYTINGTSPLEKVEGEGVLLDETFNSGFHLMFFAKPDEGYALTGMTMYTGSSKTDTAGTAQGQYYALSDGTRADGSDSSAWPFESEDQTTIPSANNDSAWKSGHGFRWALLEGNITIEGMRNAFTQAINLGCDGAQNMTKNGSNDGGYFFFTFESEKLPTLTKTITSYVRNDVTYDYTQGTHGKFGDVINYTFTIEAASTNVNYTNIVLKDDKIGYSETIADNKFDTAGTYTYTASYTINEADLDMYEKGRFVNDAELSYKYSSDYSKGNSESTASTATLIIDGIVYYAWEDGTPDGIIKDTTNYPLPEQYKLMGIDQVTVAKYTGTTEYQVFEEDGKTLKGTYKFVGWRYDGKTYQGDETITMPEDNNVGLIGMWSYTPAKNLTSLTITKKGAENADANQTFMFQVTGDGVDVTVTVQGNGKTTVDGLTAGGKYTVEELTDWSWRYKPASWKFTSGGIEKTSGTSQNTATIELSSDADDANELVFTNEKTKTNWINDGDHNQNIFTSSAN